MTQTEETFLAALSAALRGDTVPLPPGVDAGELRALATRHQLAGMTYAGLRAAWPEAEERAWSGAVSREQYEEAMRHFGMEPLFAAFEKAGLDYAPLKGWELQARYPQPWMRTMQDVDLLLRPGTMASARPVLEACGFCFEGRVSIHDKYLWPPYLHLEVHEALLSNWSAYQRAFADGWGMMEQAGEHRYRLNAAAECAYTLAHFEKHLMNQGASVRQVLDLFLCAQAMRADTRAGFDALVAQAGLRAFADNALYLAAHWFGGGDATDALERVGALVLAGGRDGNPKQARWHELCVTRESDKGTLAKAFPSRQTLEGYYPGLKGRPLAAWRYYLRRWGFLAVNEVRAGLATGAMLTLGRGGWMNDLKRMHREIL